MQNYSSNINSSNKKYFFLILNSDLFYKHLIHHILDNDIGLSQHSQWYNLSASSTVLFDQYQYFQISSFFALHHTLTNLNFIPLKSVTISLPESPLSEINSHLATLTRAKEKRQIFDKIVWFYSLQLLDILVSWKLGNFCTKISTSYNFFDTSSNTIFIKPTCQDG